MGWDLWIAIGFIATISVLAFIAGRRLGLSVYRNRPLLFAECLIFSLVFAFGLSGRLTWANAFPTPAALGWSNWLPIFLGFCAGLASAVTAIRARLRWFVSLTMGALGAGFLLLPAVRPSLFPVELENKATWHDGVCMQSHEASCGPAAAATLLHQTAMLTPTRLRFSGVQYASAPWVSAERLMSEACLTSQHGTSPLGLVRGLRLVVSGSSRRVGIADTQPHRWIGQDQLPNVAVVRFQSQRESGSVRRLLFRDGDAHAVVVHSRTQEGKWLVADPAVGWKVWSDDELCDVFTGEAIYLAGKDQD